VTVVGLISFLQRIPLLSAQTPAPHVQNTAQKGETGAPSDVLTVPDGTPIVLKLEKELSSATAKAGDPVEFTTPYPIRFEGLVIVPKGTAVSGTIVGVKRSRRGARDGEIKIEIKNLILPGGQNASLHQALKPKITAAKVGLTAERTVVMMADPFTVLIPPMMLFFKGDEQVYRAGTWMTLYINGPMNLNRNALANLEPPPYQGPAQVFIIRRTGRPVRLFLGDHFVDWLVQPIRLELVPGTYTFRVDSKAQEQPLTLDVFENHQYWVERTQGGLIAGDVREHQGDIEEFASAPFVKDRNFAVNTPDYHGSPQVMVVSRTPGPKLFCGKKGLGELWGWVEIDLHPGTYSFHTNKAKKQVMRLEVQEDHQYWIEQRDGRLFLSDFQHVHDDLDRLPCLGSLFCFAGQSKKHVCAPEVSP
jgi:hypothetical protein